MANLQSGDAVSILNFVAEVVRQVLINCDTALYHTGASCPPYRVCDDDFSARASKFLGPLQPQSSPDVLTAEKPAELVLPEESALPGDTDDIIISDEPITG